MRRRIRFHIWLPSIVLAAVLLGALLASCGGDAATSTAPSHEATTTRTIMQSGAIPTSLLEPDMVFPDVDAVVVGEVAEVLPFRSNPLADRYAKGEDDVSAPLPVIYRGAVVEVEKSFGPEKPAQRITVWYLSSGEFSEKGEAVYVQTDLSLALKVGDRVLLPITTFERFGAPLGANEYWLYHEVTAFGVTEVDQANRLVTTARSPNSTTIDSYPLSSLEAEAKSLTGTKPDRISTQSSHQ